MKSFAKMISIALVITLVLPFVTSMRSAYSQSLNFTESINLSNNDTVSTWHDVAVAGNNVYVVWQDNSVRDDGKVETSNILVKVSIDNGMSFSDPISIGTSYGSAYGPKITASGDNVYVVWVDNKRVQFSRSTDRGSDFSLPVTLSEGSKDSRFPQIAAYGKYVYVVWEYGDISYEAGVFTNTEILIRVSNDNGATFGPAINLSNNNGTSSIGGFAGAKITAYGNDVYAVWQDLTPGNFDIFLARSTDNGSTFDVINLTNNSGSSVHPTIAAFGNNVYVAYQDDTHTGGLGAHSDVFFTRSTDRGENFASPIKMSNKADAEDPKIVVSGKHVYMIWRDASEFSFGSGSIKIFFVRSTDGGKTFDPSINLTGNGWSVNAWLAVSGNSVYVAWQEKVGNKFEAFFRASTDYGINFEPAINLSKGIGDSGGPRVAASQGNVYVLWIDNGVGNADIFIRAATNPSFKLDPTIADIESEYIKNSPKQSTQSKALQFSNSINVYDTKPGFMAASAGNVYVLWMTGKTLPDGTVVGKDVLFRAINNDGSFISAIIKLSNNERSQAESLVASGNNVYVAWFEKGSSTDTYAPPKRDLFFSRSTDNGNNFEPLIKLSSDKVVYGSQIAVSGTNVYVLWMEGEVGKADILLSRSTDNGSTFNDPIKVGTGWSPHIATSGNNVYVVWQNGDVFFRRSIDNGIRFESPINLSNDAGPSISPRLAVSGNNVYIVWTDDVVWAPNKPAKRDTLFAKSTDNGSTFASPINLSNSGDADFAKIAATGNYVYVEWFKGSNAGPKLLTVSKDNGNSFDSVINLTEKIGTQISRTAYYENKVYAVWTSNGNVFLGESKDFGVSFESKINLSSNGRANVPPSIIISDNKLYVMWGEGDNFVFRAAKIAKDIVQASPLPAPITINHISNSKPRWGLDEVTISGIVGKPSSLDTITIDWGDDTISNIRIIKPDGSWGPVSHTYGLEHVGKNKIVAKLFSGRVLKASTSYEVDVQKHATSITINPISNVELGSSITVKGTLFDTDAKVGVTGRLITFNATGIEGLSSTVAFRDGVFSSKGTIPTKPSNIAVQAQFEGDSVYLPSSSSVQKYGAVETITESMVQLSNIVLVDSEGKKLSKISAGDEALIQANIANKYKKEQPLAYIVQIKNADGHTVFLSWIKGSLQNAQSMKVAIAWTPDAPGNYTAEIFVWESLTNPIPLSKISRIQLSVR